MHYRKEFLRKPESHIYVEKEILDHPRTKEILSRLHGDVIVIDSYQSVFHRPRQNYSLQHDAFNLILAGMHGQLIEHGSPVCQSFDERYFYYTSCVKNCVFDCAYCWLKGLYDSGNLVIFVDIEKVFAETEKILLKHPVYLCVSYDTDLLALEPLLGYAAMWSAFTAVHPDLTIEIRTKGAALPDGFTVCNRVIAALTLSPKRMAEKFEAGAPHTESRLAWLEKAAGRGIPVRLCFDPIMVYPGWKEDYRELLREVNRRVDLKKIRDFSIGTFRISSSYLKRMRKQEPDNAALQYPYVCSDGFYHLPDDIEKDTEQYVKELLLQYVSEEKIFFWRER